MAPKAPPPEDPKAEEPEPEPEPEVGNGSFMFPDRSTYGAQRAHPAASAPPHAAQERREHV